jgi:hypothetical protein
MSYENDCAKFDDPTLEAMLDEDAADCAGEGAFDGLDNEHEIACHDFCPDCGEHGDNCDCFADSAWSTHACCAYCGQSLEDCDCFDNDVFDPLNDQVQWDGPLDLDAIDDCDVPF